MHGLDGLIHVRIPTYGGNKKHPTYRFEDADLEDDDPSSSKVCRNASQCLLNLDRSDRDTYLSTHPPPTPSTSTASSSTDSSKEKNERLIKNKMIENIRSRATTTLSSVKTGFLFLAVSLFQTFLNPGPTMVYLGEKTRFSSRATLGPMSPD